MITLNVHLKSKPGCELELLKALKEIGDYVRESEPGTVGFYVGQDTEDPAHFNTYERFVDEEAMNLHNNSEYRTKWGQKYNHLIGGNPQKYICNEIVSK